MSSYFDRHNSGLVKSLNINMVDVMALKALNMEGHNPG